MGRSRRPRPRHRLTALAGLGALVAALVLPAVASAHPLGNFTINHYAGVHVEPDRVVLDIVVDQAEIPTFQARIGLDTDEVPGLSDEEIAAGRVIECDGLLPQLALTIDGAAAPLTLTAAGLTFPMGAGGLPTMRLVCTAEAALDPALGAAPTTIAFADRSFPERLGWREIVVSASEATVAPVAGGVALRGTSVSQRLSAYPKDQVGRPLADAEVALRATAGGPSVAVPAVPDAQPVAVPAGPGPLPSPVTAPAAPAPAAAAVPGGVGGEVPDIFHAADMTPVVFLLSVLTALALGAGHALTPGHGKTLMAAYLVGTRGTPLHAVGLGLSVSLSHTVGILVLAAVVVGAADVLPPDLVVRAAPVVAAVSILGIGAWMLLGEWRRRRAARTDLVAHDHAHEHAHDHDHAPGHDDALDTHRHGGIAHSHAPAAGSTITWRSLFVLGLAGGLIPSTSALLILLGAIAAGRPGFGFLLVVAFGLGMAAVMGGIGLVLVLARERLERVPVGTGLQRVRAAVPLVAAVLVFGFGIYLTVGALGGTVSL